FDAERMAVAGVAAYSGADPASPVEGHSGQHAVEEAFATAIVAPSVTTTAPNAVVMGLFGLHEGGHTIDPPSGMTERFERTSPEPVAGPRSLESNLTLEMADETRATPGATGTRTATASVADTWIAQMIVLRPAESARATPASR